jgi:uncharacterized protein (TIGR01777 family)
MRVTLTGGTGFIGRALARRLLEEGHAVHLLARRRPEGTEPRAAFSVWDAAAGDPPLESLEHTQAVIHLAGEPVAQRWSEAAKARIRASRVEGTRRLVGALARLERPPGVLVSASAIGIYGSRGDEWLTESSPPGHGFLAEVVRQWEREAQAAEALGLRVVRLRIGVVLSREGGALARMLPAFRAGLGGRLGSGRQWMSWIHLEDLVKLILFAVRTPGLRGPVNAVAPHPATNAEFTRALAAALRRPAFWRVPGFLLRALFGEMASVLLDSQRVRPEAALAAGFRFRRPELAEALRDLLGRAG